MRLAKGLALAAWLASVGGGFAFAWRYEATPGSGKGVDAWPSRTSLVRDETRPTVVQFIHPECPCTRAGLEEIAEIARAHPGRARWTFVLVDAPGLPKDWEASPNAQLARSIPGALVVSDRSGMEARNFGAKTSGQTFAFLARGEALFRGGVTMARGHYGDSLGLDALRAILEGRRATSNAAPVYGCALREGTR